MALVLLDRVRESTTTTGTGTITLTGAVAGFQSFSAIGNGNQTYYTITDSTAGTWEVGIGTYTSSGTTLSRTTVLSSSSGGSLVSFGAGTKDVFVTYPAGRSVYKDTANTYTVQQAFDALTANSIALTTGTITTAPVNNTDIVNKQYADAIASGIHFHEAVALATTAALPANTYNNGASGVGATLTATANGALSVDSTLTIVAERILVKNEVAGANNGVYTVTQVGSAGTPYILTRATDFDTVGTGVDQIDEGDFFLVTSGTANVNTAWVQQTAPPITIGTTALVFQQFSAPITYTAGTGLNESPTYTFNIANTGVTAATYGSGSQVPVFAVNAQGQLTTVTNTSIAIAAGAVSGLAASATTNTTDAANITTGTLPSGRLIGGYTQVTGVGVLTSGTWNATTIASAYGGTGFTTYVTGDLIYASAANTLSKLAAGTNGYVLTLAGGVPTWAAGGGGGGSAATPTTLGTVYGNTGNGTSTFITSLGYNAVASGANSVALGLDSVIDVAATNSVAVGTGTNVTGSSAVAIGQNVVLDYNSSVVIGENSGDTGTYAVVVGAGSVSGSRSITLGAGVYNNQANSIALVTGGSFTAPNAGVFIDSMRDESTGSPDKTLKYNTTTKEIFYGTAGGGGGSANPEATNGIYVNSNTISTSYTVASGFNGMSSGPVTINSGITVTVANNSRWVVL